MLHTYNTNTQELAVNSNIAFDNNWVLTRRCNCIPVISHETGSVAVSLNAPGIYYVAFNADAGAAAGIVTAQLYDGAELVPGAEASAYSAAIAQPANLAFSTLIRVCPNCPSVCDNVPAVLTVKNTGVAATYTNVAITVTKVG